MKKGRWGWGNIGGRRDEGHMSGLHTSQRQISNTLEYKFQYQWTLVWSMLIYTPFTHFHILIYQQLMDIMNSQPAPSVPSTASQAFIHSILTAQARPLWRHVHNYMVCAYCAPFISKYMARAYRASFIITYGPRAYRAPVISTEPYNNINFVLPLLTPLVTEISELSWSRLPTSTTKTPTSSIRYWQRSAGNLHIRHSTISKTTSNQTRVQSQPHWEAAIMDT